MVQNFIFNLFPLFKIKFENLFFVLNEYEFVKGHFPHKIQMFYNSCMSKNQGIPKFQIVVSF